MEWYVFKQITLFGIPSTDRKNIVINLSNIEKNIIYFVVMHLWHFGTNRCF